jgi:hypothetical protein
MSDYLCVDGPLWGHIVRCDVEPGKTDLVTVGLVGLDGDRDCAPVPAARYAVETTAHGGVPGRMRFIASNGLYRKPALPAAFRLDMSA